MTTAIRTEGFSGTLRDIAALTKPRITLMVVITAAGGMWLALRSGAAGATGASFSAGRIVLTLLTIATVVAGANALNCYLERDSDRFMTRTASRPLPAGRLAPRWALYFGVGLGLLSVPILALAANPLTGILGAIALISYVAIYTPLKQISPTALLVGAVPGALPPLMGWTAITARIEGAGLVLFAILFLWQIPHFLAISIFRQDEYERAGLKVLPSVKGLRASKVQAAFYTALLVPVSLLLFALRAAGPIYLAVAVVADAFFLAVALRGLRAEAGRAWAKRLFVTSLVYLTVLFAALMIDAG